MGDSLIQNGSTLSFFTIPKIINNHFLKLCSLLKRLAKYERSISTGLCHNTEDLAKTLARIENEVEEILIEFPQKKQSFLLTRVLSHAKGRIATIGMKTIYGDTAKRGVAVKDISDARAMSC